MQVSAWHSPYSMMIRSNLTAHRQAARHGAPQLFTLDDDGWSWVTVNERPRRFKAYFQKFAKIPEVKHWQDKSFWPSLTKLMQIVLKVDQQVATWQCLVVPRSQQEKLVAWALFLGELGGWKEKPSLPTMARSRLWWMARMPTSGRDFFGVNGMDACVKQTFWRMPTTWNGQSWWLWCHHQEWEPPLGLKQCEERIAGLSTAWAVARWQRIPHWDQWSLESFRCPHEERQIMWSWLESVCQKLDVEIDLRPELHPVREEGQEAWTGSCFTNETALFHDSVSRKSFWFPNGVISQEEFWSNATVTFALADPFMIIQTGGPFRPWAPRAVKRFPAP